MAAAAGGAAWAADSRSCLGSRGAEGPEASWGGPMQGRAVWGKGRGAAALGRGARARRCRAVAAAAWARLASGRPAGVGPGAIWKRGAQGSPRGGGGGLPAPGGPRAGGPRRCSGASLAGRQTAYGRGPARRGGRAAAPLSQGGQRPRCARTRCARTRCAGAPPGNGPRETGTVAGSGSSEGTRRRGGGMEGGVWDARWRSEQGRGCGCWGRGAYRGSWEGSPRRQGDYSARG
jgi:hypothetical protein